MDQHNIWCLPMIETQHIVAPFRHVVCFIGLRRNGPQSWAGKPGTMYPVAVLWQLNLAPSSVRFPLRGVDYCTVYRCTLNVCLPPIGGSESPSRSAARCGGLLWLPLRKVRTMAK